MLGLLHYLWRLIPGNPILLRVVEAGGKRRRDLLIRCGYLGLLVIIVFVALLGSMDALGSMGLGGLSKTSARLFQQMSYLQLALVALLAPIFTAGAITQEKDSQTYDILLSTPLTNGQIVLGSLLSRLFFVLALLVSGIPIFAITQIFGGVAIRSIATSFGIAAATAFFTGALAMAIATFKVGTRRTIFSFYLFIVIYLVGGFLLDKLDYLHPLRGHETDANGQLLYKEGRPIPIRATTSWLTGVHPFLALRVIFHERQYTPPELAELPATLRSWPIGWYLSRPHNFYISAMFFLGLVMVLPSVVLLRRVAQSTISLRALVLQKLRLTRGDRTRKPRSVWHNPIAWREARTKASAARASLLRYGFMAAGLAGAVYLLVGFASLEPVSGDHIQSGAWDPNTRTLAVVPASDPTRAVTWRVSPNPEVRLNGKPASLDDLAGRTWLVTIGTDQPSSTVLSSIHAREQGRRIAGDTARRYLLGMSIIEFAVILLIVTNAAASTVTREKEDGTLDLLLSTPITSRYYIWGKLRGLVSFVLPLIAVPVASSMLFIVYDLLRLLGGSGAGFQWIVLPEAALIMPPTLIIVAAFAAILGMHMSLRCRKTVVAVMGSVGIVVGLCATLGFCGYAVLDKAGEGSPIALVFAAFSPFTVLTVLIDPWTFARGAFEDNPDLLTPRLILLIFSWATTAGYAAVVWTMYRGMVKNFDMTIRKQSR